MAQGFSKTQNVLGVRWRSAFTILYAGLSMGVLAGFASFAVDWGRVQLTKTELQRAADAGARAGASQLGFGVVAVQNAAVTFAGDNAADSSSVVIDPLNDIDFGTWDTTARMFTALTGAARSSANAVRVTARRTAARGNAVPLVFGAIVGVGSYDATKSSIATYSTTYLDYSGGFSGVTNLSLNGSAVISGSNLRLTTTTANQAGSAWYYTKVPVSSFVCNFSFLLTSASADGFTFTIQNKTATTIGSTGGGLGFAGITSSAAIKFDIYNNSGEGTTSTGLFLNGANPSNVGSYDMTSAGVILKSGHVMNVRLVYDGTTLTETVTDASNSAVFSQAYTVNIPGTIGSTTAYVGFTGGTGGSTAMQNIQNWTYTAPGALTCVK